jgi:hypothetical protein
MIENAPANPVFDATEQFDPDELALRCAKAFALDDTVVFGACCSCRPTRARAVLQADAQLNAPPPPTAVERGRSRRRTRRRP